MASLKAIPISLLLLTLATATPVQYLPFSVRQPISNQISLGSCKSASDCVDRDGIGLKCVSGACTPRALGKSCLTSLDCSTFTACTSGICQFGTPGTICTMWRQCALGNSCMDRVCKPGVVGAACELPYNCGEGLTCKSLKCVVGDAKAPCRTNKDCQSGLCRIVITGRFVTGVCTAPLPAIAPAASPTPAPPTIRSTPVPQNSVSATEPKTASPSNGPSNGKVTPAPSPASGTGGNGKQTPTATRSPNIPPTSALPATSASATPSASVPAPNTDVNASSSNVSPNLSPTPPATVPICIGSSSHRAGVTLKGLLRPVHRMQIHPLRLFSSVKRVQMHCYASEGSRLCASASHIVEHEGKLMYMSDFCVGRACTIDMEIPLNFKGVCGEHIEFLEGLKVTQHAAVDTAVNAADVARMECALRARNRALWTVRTL